MKGLGFISKESICFLGLFGPGFAALCKVAMDYSNEKSKVYILFYQVD